MSKKESNIDVLFINPRDLITAVPYVKSIQHAAVLREAGMTVAMIDPAPLKISHKEIVQLVGQYKPSVICLSVFPSTLPDAYKTIQLIKEHAPQSVLVLEGYHVNADPEIIIHIEADYGLLGDAEFNFRDLCKDILGDNPVNLKADGLAINKSGELIVNKGAVIQNINLLPEPAYDLLPIGKYYSASTDKRIMYLFTTRGCPYDCSFCASAAQRNFRDLTLENKLKRIDSLVNNYKIEWLEFMDLTFTLSKKRTIEFCEAIVAAGLKFDWGCETRADLLDLEIITAMKKAGCKKITMGVEAGNEAIRYNTGKKITNEQFKTAFDLCRNNGIRTMANFIMGHPDESEAQLMESLSFAKELRPFNVFFVRMTPLPDVDIFKNGVANGEIEPDIWLQYMRGEAEHPVYCPSSLSPKRLNYLYTKAYRNYYFRWSSIKKYLPLFMNVKFLFKSLIVFKRIAFGAPVFK